MNDIYDEGGSFAESLAEGLIAGKVISDMSGDGSAESDGMRPDNLRGWKRISDQGKHGIIAKFVRVNTYLYIIASIAALIYVTVTGK